MWLEPAAEAASLRGPALKMEQHILSASFFLSIQARIPNRPSAHQLFPWSFLGTLKVKARLLFCFTKESLKNGNILSQFMKEISRGFQFYLKE